MKRAEKQLARLIKESLSVNIMLDVFYNRALSGSEADENQLKILLQSGSPEVDAWLASKIIPIEKEIEEIEQDIIRMQNLPYDPYYDDVTQTEIVDMYVDADMLQKQITYLNSLKSL